MNGKKIGVFIVLVIILAVLKTMGLQLGLLGWVLVCALYFFLTKNMLKEEEEKKEETETIEGILPELTPLYRTISNFVVSLTELKEGVGNVTFSLLMEQQKKLIGLLEEFAELNPENKPSADQNNYTNLDFLRSQGLPLIKGVVIHNSKSKDDWEEDIKSLNKILHSIKVVSGSEVPNENMLLPDDSFQSSEEVFVVEEESYEQNIETLNTVEVETGQVSDGDKVKVHERLANVGKAYSLFKEGILTEEEFTKLKQRIIEG